MEDGNIEGAELERPPLEPITKELAALTTRIEDSIGNMELDDEQVRGMIDDAARLIKEHEQRMGEGNEDFDRAMDTLIFTKENLEELLEGGSTRVSKDFLREEEDDMSGIEGEGREAA